MPAAVAVTGLGVLTSIGRGSEAFAAALRRGACGITASNADGLGVAGRLPPFDLGTTLADMRLPEPLLGRALKAGRRAPLSQQASLLTALEAWTQAFGGNTTGAAAASIIVAGNNVAPGYSYRMREKYADNFGVVPASYALHFLDTDQVGILSEVLGIRGEGFTIGGASASGNMGILQAWRQIRYGIADVCVVVGALTDLSPLELQAFRNTGALGGTRYAAQPEEACRPFDRDREGFIYGQGSACLILESAASARARGARVLGYVAGAATCLDANRLSNPSVEGEARAMRLALEQAGLLPDAVNYVNAHATSSLAGDEVEVKALQEVFGPRVSRVAINATKGLTGHCLHAAGVVEAAATLLQMNGRFLHPNRNLRKPIEQTCGFAGESTRDLDIQAALSNSFGFGGINTAVVLTKSGGSM
ncbi:MAG: hypothetical protein JNK87_29090 [Bryobacterales bacterium]|nr:hypothetical protein [Bryobacterales bacterium]